MRKVILVHANCINVTAKGDYAFAGNVAKDLFLAMREKAIDDIEIILISNKDGVSRFCSLYGVLDSTDLLRIDGLPFRVTTFENFDTVQYETIAFIDANRCAYTSSEILKRVLSPESKFLFIGNLNQFAFSSADKPQYLAQISMQQPNLYNLYEPENILVGSAGIGADRLGLPSLKSVDELVIENPEHPALPKFKDQVYGFMYLAMLEQVSDFQLIAQYLKLTSLDKYCLVGNFGGKLSQIKSAYDSEITLKVEPRIPDLKCYTSLPNDVMRTILAHATSLLVVSTGITSTLEVLKDGKLPFYQYMSINQAFVESYLRNLKIVIDEDSLLIGSFPKLLNDLAGLLFAPKPLNRSQLIQLRDLLQMPTVTSKLVEKNKALLRNEAIVGNVGVRMLDFIFSNPTPTLDMQKIKVCLSLKKESDAKIPPLDTAIRRAAAYGKVLELKILMTGIKRDFLDLQDPKYKRSAIHWAALEQHKDCVSLLTNAGANLNIQDLKGQTPLHTAASLNNQFLIKLLIHAGASLDVRDELNRTPSDCVTQPKTLDFIQTCCKS